MSLREKILIVLLCILCCYAGLEFFVLQKVIAPELTKQEELQSKENLYRCAKALETHLNQLQKELAELAKSGQFFSALQSPSADQLQSIGSRLDADFLIIYDLKWKPVDRHMNGVDFDAAEAMLFRPNHPFLRKKMPGALSKALIHHQKQLYFVTSAPITKSSLSRTIEGTVVAGRIVNDERLEALRKQLYMGFNWDLVDPEQLLGQNKDIVARIHKDHLYDVVALGKEYMQVSTVLYDYYKKPVLILKTFKDRSISRQSIKAMQTALFCKIITGVAAVLVLTVLLQCIIIKPIIKLIRYIVTVANPAAADEVLSFSQKNELAALGDEFDRMCRRLQDAQVKLMEKSYLSGVTEMSSGILHNVRNALSPITTRIERLKDQFKGIPLENLEQAQSELQHAPLDADRRRDLMRFVDLTFQDVLTNLNDMVTGLDDLSQQVVEIEDMLSLQRTFGREDRPVEFIQPNTLLDKALEMIPEHIRTDYRITVHPKIKKLPAVPVEPTTFVQILQNLLINAAESLEREKPLYPKISVEAYPEIVDGRHMLHWQVEDNGAGIPNEKLRQIFERGASSKRKGLTGIGLHWCANTITAMKGAIWAESRGLHQGAAFHLRIPMTAEEYPLELTKGQTE